MNQKKVSQILIEQLQEFKVQNIYSYAGDTILKLFAELEESELNLYTTKHEATAGFMASAEAKLTGELAVCASHSGPGTANIINGIADAHADKTPVLLITGQVPTYNIGTNYKQYLDQLELIRPLTVFSDIVTNPESIVDLLVKAMSLAINKGGVSQLVIPMDLWDQQTNAQIRKYPPHLDKTERSEQDTIKQASQLIEQAKQPVILYGRGARNCREELIELASKIKAGLINTLPATGIIEYDIPQSLGGLGHAGSPEATEILQQADLIITLGATWWPMDYVPREPKVIQFDLCKENIGMKHPIEVGVVGEIKESLQLLLTELTGKENQNWTDKINQARTTWFERLSAESHQEGYPLPPQAVIRVISEQACPDEIISVDSGDNTIWFGKFFGNRCQELLLSGTWRTMGFSLPAALAAKINNPDTPVTSIIGDGGISMFLGEMLTASKYNIPVRIIILNNGMLAMEHNKMVTADLAPTEVNLNNPDFVKLAKACGVKGFKVENPEQLKEILLENKNSSEPLVIDVPTATPIPAGTKL
ncbi:thiamine pyrophosphate-binding protein [Natroniella sulfidigena]|uniref:thiamine pyrophosphate-binding protein n=1 Tax=Natroniella sulfidigena TaxID=723921 RepID=UPI002009E1EC|nr:thiamine pyrophosphate-binding protein [Natroniella sulfidigena]MCK8817649.1 thiamine pyrophosphate-binding protein [Natroniella sulfidigena]